MQCSTQPTAGGTIPSARWPALTPADDHNYDKIDYNGYSLFHTLYNFEASIFSSDRSPAIVSIRFSTDLLGKSGFK